MQEKLIKLLNNSYSPYSKFRVAAIVKTNDGREFYGVNVENASYGATVCAERNAILSAVTNGYRKGDFDSLHVMCDNEKIGMPCFICRQVIEEFFEDDKIITAYNPSGKQENFTVKQLCPYPFNDEDLK